MRAQSLSKTSINPRCLRQPQGNAQDVPQGRGTQSQSLMARRRNRCQLSKRRQNHLPSHQTQVDQYSVLMPT